MEKEVRKLKGISLEEFCLLVDAVRNFYEMFPVVVRRASDSMWGSYIDVVDADGKTWHWYAKNPGTFMLNNHEWKGVSPFEGHDVDIIIEPAREAGAWSGEPGKVGSERRDGTLDILPLVDGLIAEALGRDKRDDRKAVFNHHHQRQSS